MKFSRTLRVIKVRLRVSLVGAVLFPNAAEVWRDVLCGMDNVYSDSIDDGLLLSRLDPIKLSSGTRSVPTSFVVNFGAFLARGAVNGLDFSILRYGENPPVY